MNLKSKHYEAIEAILTSPSLEVAALKLGVGVRTLERWSTNPDFREASIAYAESRFREAALLLATSSVDAVKVLRSALNESDPGRNKIQAANAILSQSLKFMELSHFNERLSKLERSNESQVETEAA